MIESIYTSEERVQIAGSATNQIVIARALLQAARDNDHDHMIILADRILQVVGKDAIGAWSRIGRSTIGHSVLR